MESEEMDDCDAFSGNDGNSFEYAAEKGRAMSNEDQAMQ